MSCRRSSPERTRSGRIPLDQRPWLVRGRFALLMIVLLMTSGLMTSGCAGFDGLISTHRFDQPHAQTLPRRTRFVATAPQRVAASRQPVSQQAMKSAPPMAAADADRSAASVIPVAASVSTGVTPAALHQVPLPPSFVPPPAPAGGTDPESTVPEALPPLTPSPEIDQANRSAALNIACQAAAHSTSVALLRSERALLRSTRDTTTHPLSLFDRLIGLRIAMRANEAADDALAIYHQLAGGVAALTTIDRSLAELDTAWADALAADREGLLSASHALPAQRAELLRRREEIAALLIGGQARLEAMTGGPVPLPLAASPLPQPVPPPVNQAVSVGLRTRADLNLLRVVIAGLDRRSLPIAVGVLQQFDPAVGVAPPGFLPCNLIAAEEQVTARRRQLCLALSRQEQLLGAEIAAAAERLHGLAAEYRAAEEMVTQRRLDRVRLESRRAAGADATAAEVTAARLAEITAEGERDRIGHEYQKQDAKLRGTQGLHAVSCGYQRG